MGLRNGRPHHEEMNWKPHTGKFKVIKLPTHGPGSGIEDQMTEADYKQIQSSGRVITSSDNHWA